MTTFTSDPSYFMPIRPKIHFFSPDGDDFYFSFNGFSNPEDVNVMYMDTSNTIGESGDFNIIIEDSANIVEKDHIRNAKVKIELGKTEADLSYFMIGFADIFDIQRPRTAFQQYRVSGFGSAIQASELLMLIRQAANEDNEGNLNTNDPKFTVKRLFQRAVQESKFRPLNRHSLGDFTGWGTNMKIDQSMNTNVPVLNEVFTTYWDFFDRMAALEGCDWFIDYSSGTEVFNAQHPMKMNTGVRIKSGDLKLANDNAEKTSYIKQLGFNSTEDSSMSAGVRTGLYTQTIIDRKTIAQVFEHHGGTYLNKRFIAQQVPILNDQRRITELAFKLKLIGEPASPNSRVNGVVVKDDGNKPTGKILGTFEIPLSSIEENTQAVFIPNIDLHTRFLEGSNLIWLILKDRAGVKGDVESDPDNTVEWRHNGKVGQENKINDVVVRSAVAEIDSENDRDNDNLDKQDWKVSATGPTYTFSIYSNIRRLLARTNPTMAAIVRRKEGLIDSSFLQSEKSVNRFLGLHLGVTAHPRRTISSVSVSVPNKYLFRPYQVVNFNDGLSDIQADFQIVRAAYIISALPGDPQLGTYQCELTLNNSFNSLLGSCSCL